MNSKYEGVKQGTLSATALTDQSLAVRDWQIEEIKQAIKEANAGDFVTDAEFAEIVKKYAG